MSMKFPEGSPGGLDMHMAIANADLAWCSTGGFLRLIRRFPDVFGPTIAY